MRVVSILLMSFICVYSSTVVANTKGIEVIGKASVSVEPDLFSLTIQIKERGRSATKTKALVDHKSQLITDMFIQEGIKPSAIDSSQVTMYPIYEKPSITIEPTKIKTQHHNEKVTLSTHRTDQVDNKKMTQFDVGRTIRVSFTEWQIYDKVLDQVVKLGVSHISPMEMSFQQPEQYYQKALSNAIENAKQKAIDIAKQAGVTLGSLASLKETSHFAPVRYRMMSESSVGFNSSTTKKAITAQVVVNYHIAL
ncbi:SIMPL domain-containing protein [Thalassotalea sp. G2M2-11]|uniref:SIMPL domain-containing protein n=1 Tax=Thalassotalea sp. G2M2-11 TaxID=2787627 RepID=UPI0019D01AEE|nr:SIMPL domain-containing protein [Thalassotalea sp. G2M2-11]